MCNKFIFDTDIDARTVQIRSSDYSGLTLADYEGSYKLTGRWIHESTDMNDFYDDSKSIGDFEVSYTVLIKLNCDDVEIIAPSSVLTFNIDIPATAPEFLNPGSTI